MTARPRGRCPVCRQTAVLRKDGKLAKHQRLEEGRWHTVACEGSEHAPAAERGDTR